MTILSVIRAVCPKIGLTVPDAVFTSTLREHVELQALANEMAERISKAHEWQKLATVATITGDGSDTSFDLPSDYDRMPQKAQMWSSEYETPLYAVPDRDAWLGIDVRSLDTLVNRWTIYGGQIHIKPAVGNGATVKYFYQSNLIVAPESGDNQTEFEADTDTFRLNERLLRLGMIWQWREGKGLPYAEDLETYEEAKEKLIATDKGSRIIRTGGMRSPSGIQIAYPRSIDP